MKNYHNVMAFLRNKNRGYKPKKSLSFTEEDFHTFIVSAPDEIYLLHKVVLIIGIAGALRGIEIFQIKNADVVDNGNVLQIEVRDTKNHTDRRFVVVNSERIKYVDILKKYASLRPESRTDERYLVAYKNGKCVNNPVGIHKIRGIPCEAAKFLGKTDPQLYTGHALRRTGATILADSGATLVQLKQHGGWKSSTVAEGYVDQSNSTKMDAANRILKSDIKNLQNNSNFEKQVAIQGCSDCSISINIQWRSKVIVASNFNRKWSYLWP